MKRTTGKRLELSKQTVRQLSTESLERVVGGQAESKFCDTNTEQRIESATCTNNA